MMYDIYLNKMRETQLAKEKRTKTGKTVTEKSQPSLTEREKAIIRLLCDGLQTKEVAGKLNVSPRTVETTRIKY